MIVADRSNQGNSLTVRDGQGGGNGRWESTSIPIQWADPQPLLTVPGTPQVGKNFFLDEVGLVKGFVSVTPVSLVWKDRVVRYEVKLTQGLTVSLQVQRSWTIPNGSWTHRRIAPLHGQCYDLYRRYMGQKESEDEPSSMSPRSSNPRSERRYQIVLASL